VKSRFELAAFASIIFAPMDVADLKSWFAITPVEPFLGKASMNSIMLMEYWYALRFGSALSFRLWFCIFSFTL
jgi:hypothetical protein